jgi:hypothetical protein
MVTQTDKPFHRFSPSMRFIFCQLSIVLLCVCLSACNKQPKLSQISGTVTFKGDPVPAGFLQLTPDVARDTRGEVRVLQIKDGVYDSSKEEPPGLPPGHYFLRIDGFDGKRIPFFGQGKQIFNAVTGLELEIPEGVSQKDFVIPESAGQNVQIQRTADT